jgi:hypothetical protein
MSRHVIHDLSTRQIALRVAFSLALTAVVIAGAYFTISWLAALRP